MSRRPWVALAILAAVAIYVARTWSFLGMVPNSDVYTYVAPTMAYALRALGDGGRGLLWNPLQNCGQPLFANSQSALLYPANVAFLPGDFERGWHVLLFINVFVGGVGMYGLCRTLGTGRVPALVGALVFELARVTHFLIGWTSMASGPYVWVPAALCCTERVVRAPTLRRGLALGLVLAVALLPGAPQLVFYTYQWIAVRLVWELVARRGAGGARLIGAMTTGLAVAPLLVAGQLIPSAEVSSLSVRNTSLSMASLLGYGSCYWSWDELRESLRQGPGHVTPFLLLPTILAVASLTRPSTRRPGAFYAVMAVVTTLLALARDVPLYAWYVRLPLGTLFRCPDRFLWMTSVAMAALAGLGTEALLAGDAASAHPRRWAGPAALLAAMAAFAALAAGPAPPLLWGLATLVVVASVVVAIEPRWRTAAGLLVAASVAYGAYALPAKPLYHLVRNSGRSAAEARFFARLKERMSPQERVYMAASPLEMHISRLWPRLATVYGVASVQDFEPQVTSRYADFWLSIQEGRYVSSPLEDPMLPVHMPAALTRRLFDLTGARYVVIDTPLRRSMLPASPPMPNIDSEGTLQLYFNGAGLPRARWVPRVEVVPDPRALLERLTRGTDDLEQLALLETPPASGFLGTPANARDGSVTFVTNDPEHVVLRVVAPARGFLLLADQHFPGWHATVDGRPTPILRANYAFRLLEVPGGSSTVEFRYRPASLAVGLAVSIVTAVGMTLAYRRGGSQPAVAARPG